MLSRHDKFFFMIFDDDDAKSNAGADKSQYFQVAPKNLEPLSVDELEGYVISLKEEIIRVEAEIRKKKSYLDAAASLFKDE